MKFDIKAVKAVKAHGTMEGGRVNMRTAERPRDVLHELGRNMTKLGQATPAASTAGTPKEIAAPAWRRHFKTSSHFF